MTLQNYAVTALIDNKKKRYTTGATSPTNAIHFVLHTYGLTISQIRSVKPLPIS